MSTTYGAFNKMNCTWPLTDSGHGWQRAALVDRIEAALMHLLRTPRGSIIHDLDYGTDYYRLKNQGISLNYDDPSTIPFHELAKNQIAKYVPDIVVTELTFVPSTQDPEAFKLSVRWQIPAPATGRAKEFATPRTTTVSV